MLHSTDFGSSLRLFSFGICTNDGLPKIRKNFKFSEPPLQISSGLRLSFRHGTLLMRKQAVFAASAQAAINQHTPYTLNYRAILQGRIRATLLVNDAIVDQERGKLFAKLFSTIVRPKNFHFSSTLVFHHFLKFKKSRKNITFRFN